MLEVIIAIATEIADFFIDLWIHKILKRKK